MRQLALDIGLAAGPTLDNFHAGHNTQALAHLRQCVQLCASNPGAASAVAPLGVPTYLWGEVGTGKSHLLRAVHEALRNVGLRCGWLDTSVQAIQGFDEGWSAVLLDDIHHYSAAQQALAFNWLINANSPATGQPRWVLAAGDQAPAGLTLREDLRSRLGWGHVFHLQALPEPEQRAVLREQAAARGIALTDDVMTYMLSRFTRDLGSLANLLDELDAYALRTQRAITIPLLKTMLDHS